MDEQSPDDRATENDAVGRSTDVEPAGAESASSQPARTAGPSPLRKFLRRWRWPLIGMPCLFFAFLAWLVFDNNYSLSSRSRDEFMSDLDHRTKIGTEWMTERREKLGGYKANPALTFMVRDMADMTKDPRLSTSIKKNPQEYNVWRLLIDPQAKFELPETYHEPRTSMVDYQRWIVFALAPEEFPLSPQDKIDMYLPDTHRRGSLTHLLLAFLVLREHGRTTEKDEELIDHLCERIFAEAI